MASDPICVRRTATVEEAELVAAWLEDGGVPATVIGQDSLGVHAFGVTDRDGVGIYVADEQAADQAKVLLAEHDKHHAHRADAASTIEVTCEDCGHVGAFPLDQSGSVQQCAECGGFVDVPEAP